MQWASSITKAIKFFKYMSVASMLLHSIPPTRASGEIKIIWYSPFIIDCFAVVFVCLSVMSVADILMAVIAATWSCISATRGDTSNAQNQSEEIKIHPYPTNSIMLSTFCKIVFNNPLICYCKDEDRPSAEGLPVVGAPHCIFSLAANSLH